MPKTKRLVLGCATVVLLAGVLACATPMQDAESGGPAQTVAARVGDTTINLDQVDEIVLRNGVDAFQALYEARRRALDELIAEELLTQEAAARGITEEQLVEAEITPKIAPVTDEEVGQFYEQNKARLRNMSLEQVGGQIRSFLGNQNAARARAAYLTELKEKSDVRIELEPFRVDVTIAENDPVRGPDHAKVTILEYSDFQ